MLKRRWKGHAAFRESLVTVSYLHKSKSLFNLTGRSVKQTHALLPWGFKLRTSPVAPLSVTEMIPLVLSHSSHLRLNLDFHKYDTFELATSVSTNRNLLLHFYKSSHYCIQSQFCLAKQNTPKYKSYVIKIHCIRPSWCFWELIIVDKLINWLTN